MKLWNKHKPRRVPLEARFTPLPDITVYELAVILSNTMQQPVFFEIEDWKQIDPAVQRHFK